jgi:hypothetical protein
MIGIIVIGKITNKERNKSFQKFSLINLLKSLSIINKIYTQYCKSRYSKECKNELFQSQFILNYNIYLVLILFQSKNDFLENYGIL